MLLLDLTADQIAQVLHLSKVCKPRFAMAAKAVLDSAEQLGMEKRVADAAIIGELMLLAAWMHDGNKRDFLRGADWALDRAVERRRAEGLA